ncbi:MAG: DUF1127 domain-containing protein [Rhodospirillaceae bacterium]|nr:DUF1127 domain-containing protein [Rhodospirillaceae bacterium]
MSDITLTHPTHSELGSTIAGFFTGIVQRHTFNRTTHELSLLNDHTLADIGLSRASLSRATTIEELQAMSGGSF